MTKHILYQAPAVEFLDVELEGVLCTSGDDTPASGGGLGTIKDWVEGGSIDF